MYVNEADGQLGTAHLILGYIPISLAFQAPKYVIKAHDPRLHCISVAYQGFVVPEGILILEGTLRTQPFFVATHSKGACSSQLILEEEEEEEGIIDLSDSSDEFEVFNRTQSPENILDEMGIQRKPQKSLLELTENQPGKGAPGKSTQSQLPLPPHKSPSPASQPSQPSRPKLADPKRKREQKGKDVVETGRSRPTREDEAQRVAKQEKVSHAPQRGVERADN